MANTYTSYLITGNYNIKDARLNEYQYNLGTCSYYALTPQLNIHLTERNPSTLLVRKV